jgi:outer membrane protein TolC
MQIHPISLSKIEGSAKVLLKQYPLILGLCIASYTSLTIGQNLPAFKTHGTNFQAISLTSYLNELNDKNTTIKVRRLNSDSASAIAKQAGMPHLSPLLTYSKGSIYTQQPYIGYTNPSSNTFGATVTVEGWGKRSAREAYAQAEANRQVADMVNESRSVETQAIFNYIDALRTKLLWQSYQGAIDKLNGFKTNDASKYKDEFISSQKVLNNDLKFFSYGLLSYLGEPPQSLPLPIGTLNIPPKSFDINALISQAQEKRPDISTNKASIESASANLELVQANRNIDLMPGVYYTETPPYTSGGIGYGSQKSFSFILTVPLGNSFVDNSDVIVASNAVTEHETNLISTKTKIVTEINQTYLQYESARERLKNANAAFKLADAQKNAGLSAILRYREAESELIEARAVHAKTLILLERVSGNFDVPSLN